MPMHLPERMLLRNALIAQKVALPANWIVLTPHTHRVVAAILDSFSKLNKMVQRCVHKVAL